MSDPNFGLSIQPVDNDPRPAIATDMSIIGLVFTAPDADAGKFPLNTPVKFASNDTAMLTAMGKEGTGYNAVELINLQLGSYARSATIVGVRVTKGASDDETITNLRGDASLRTGMFALLDAAALIGVTPRLIGVPGYTHQPARFIGAIAIGAGGKDYVVGDVITGTGGGGSGFAGRVTAVSGTGAITGVEITAGGAGYTSAPTLSVTSTAGTTATLTATVDTAGNAIVAALPSLLDRLLAVAVVDGPSTTFAAASAWREAIQSKRIIPNGSGIKFVDAEDGVIDVPAAPAILGVAVRRDHEFGGRPFHSWANQPVYGIVGTSRPIEFSILDGSTEGQQLLEKNIGIIVRGESGDGAVADGGFVFVGTDNCSEDPLWRFYNQVRGRDYIHLMTIKTLRYFLGRRNLDRGTVEDVMATMKSALRDIQATGDLLDFRVLFNRDTNSPEQLRLGRLTITFQAEEPPVLRHLTVQSSRYRQALDGLLNDLISTLNTNT